MNDVRPIFWQEGQPILQHHFQQDFLYNRVVVSRISKSIHPYMWGFRNICIEKIDIDNKKIDISDGEFWFKEEIPLLLNKQKNQPGDTIILQKDFESIADMPDGIFYVCLYLPDNDNVKEIQIDELYSERKNANVNYSTRFISTKQEEEVNDIHTNETGNVYRLYTHLQIVIKTKNHLNDRVLPFLKINKQDNVITIKKYIPPSINCVLSIEEKNPFSMIIDKITSELKKAAKDLSTFGTEIMNDGEKDDKYRMILIALHRNIAIIHERLIEKQTVHPFEIFLTLKVLISELSAFSKQYPLDTILKDIKYDHFDLYLTFELLKKQLKKLLKEISSRPLFKYIIKPGDKQPVTINEKIFTGIDQYEFYLVFKYQKQLIMKKEKDELSLRKKIEKEFDDNLLLFGSPEKVDILWRSSSKESSTLKPVKPIYTPNEYLPDLLLRRSHVICFKITKEDIQSLKPIDGPPQIKIHHVKNFDSIEEIQFIVIKMEDQKQ